jgi:hypothetical protein
MAADVEACVIINESMDRHSKGFQTYYAGCEQLQEHSLLSDLKWRTGVAKCDHLMDWDLKNNILNEISYA